MHEAVLVFVHPDDAVAAAIAGALAPESAAEVPKTTARVSREAARIRVEVRAEDLSSLRAALNSYLRWADAAERAARLAG